MLLENAWEISTLFKNNSSRDPALATLFQIIYFPWLELRTYNRPLQHAL